MSDHVMKRLPRADLEADELSAFLRRAEIIDISVKDDPDGGINEIILEAHIDGEPNHYIRLWATGEHTQGWIIAEGALVPAIGDSTCRGARST